ncbi:MAG: rod shape-determining protein MreC [bacterium]
MKKKFIFLTIAIILSLGVVFDFVFNIGIIKVAGNLFTPVELVFTTTGSSISGFFGGLANIGTLQAENSDLKNKLNQALSENAILAESKKENDSLTKLLGFQKSSGLNLLPGIITSFDPTLSSGINVFVDDSSQISRGSAVIADGYLIGSVSKINGNNLNVSLVIDSDSVIPAVIKSKNTTGIAKGLIGNGLILDQVPQGDEVTKGDLVVTSGLGGNLPSGIILGRVSDIQKVSGSIFQQIRLDPMVEFSKIRKVMIVKK